MRYSIKHMGLNRSIMDHILKDKRISHLQRLIETPVPRVDR